MKIWTDATTSNEWDVLESVGQGGQGEVSKARLKESGVEGCLKKLKDHKKPERRARFAREAVAYDTCRHLAIPRLIQSNALQHESPNHKLFIVTEFVPGGTLTDWMDQQSMMDLPDASALLLALLDTLAYMHGQQWVHRDIKPDNIVLRNGAPASPVLVDFGLSFKEGVTASFDTEHGQELGNRFLRLPELGVGSESKQDERSDVAFAAGVFFYVLTGITPATLSDENGKMPHQRPAALPLLSSIAGAGLMALLGFFDRAFNPSIRDRFASAVEMRGALEAVTAAIERRAQDSAAEDLDFIAAHVNRLASQAESEIATKVDSGRTTIEAEINDIANRVGPTYGTFFGGFKRIPKGISYSMGFAHFERQEEQFVPRFEVQAVGDEIVVRANGDVVYRTAQETPNFDGAFRGVIRAIFAKGIRALIDDPVSQVASRGHFNSRPFTNLALALAFAKAQGKPLFLVLFDSASPTYSQLNYLLGYFLEHEETKNLVEQNFVVAVVPSSQPEAAAFVPPDNALEKALWVVVGLDGSLLARETVYANGEEGLKRVRQLLPRLSSAG